MPKGYYHLTYELRCQIYILKDSGSSAAAISRALNVSPSTISRELSRNMGTKGYCYLEAQEKAIKRKNSKPSSKLTTTIISTIDEKLNEQWSPVQISGWMQIHEMECVSYKTIYNYIAKDAKLGGSLRKQLRHNGKKYNKQSKGNSGRGCIPNRIDIDQRPAIVDQKTRLGDWELDTIIGAAHKGVIVSMVERVSKLTKIVKVSRKTADEVAQAIIDQLMPYKAFVHTLTSDNGKEFAFHQKISLELSAEFYFATPYHSWERGLNEHTNGLIRQYFPKSQSFTNLTSEDILRVENLLNSRPRKVLGFATPQETFDKLSSNMLSLGAQ